MLLSFAYCRYGGAVFQGSCIQSKTCPIIGITPTAGASMIFFKDNVGGKD